MFHLLLLRDDFFPPAAIVSRFNQEAADALRWPRCHRACGSLGPDPVGRVDAFAVLQRDEIKKWGEVIRDAKIKIE